VLPIVVLGVLGFVVSALLFPSNTIVLTAKEGALEHISHGLLVVAGLGWALAAKRAWGARTQVRWVALGLAIVCGLLLGEELDWGAVYGFGPGGNLHNAWRGASYLLFAIPPVLLIVVVGFVRGDAAGRVPRRRDAIGVVVLGSASIVGTLVWPAWEAALDEVAETIFYVGLVWMAYRPLGHEPKEGILGHSTAC